MDNEHINRLRTAMNETTYNFLGVFTPKLDELFDKELSSVYLNSMNEHLQTFYDDVLSELQTKENTMSKRIEELLSEAMDLKRKLNVDIDFELDRTNGTPLMVYQAQLDLNLTEMREKYSQKMDQIKKCLESQQVLCDELNENLRTLSTDPLASDSEIYDFENYLIDLESEKASRLSKIECLQHEINALCKEIGIEISDQNQTIHEPTMANIRYLQNERDRYKKDKEKIKQECDQLLQKLEVLWDCLDAPVEVRSNIRKIAAELKLSSVSELNRELKICKVAKQENLKYFIEKLRIKLIEQWDKIYKSQEERDKFEFLRSDTYTDDLLQLHEMELDECTKFYNDNKRIFDLFIERNQWWDKKKALEAKQNEPNRYNNRGGQLLKEEKERKQTDIEIPKIERKIKADAEEFRRQNGRDFMINGVCIIQLMEKDWEAKELLKSARKAIATPGKSAVTPKTPLRGQTLALKRMASSTNLGMTTGNLAKKRHLDVPQSRDTNRPASVQKMIGSSSYLVRSHTKRNLLSQYNDENVTSFAKPIGKSMQQKRLNPINKKPTTLANISAGKILKKYRLSNRRQSSQKGIISDESLVNYDAFENNIKTSQISNSSVVGQQNNFQERQMISKSTKNNNYRAKSPLKPSNLGALQINDIIDLV